MNVVECATLSATGRGPKDPVKSDRQKGTAIPCCPPTSLLSYRI